MKSSVARAVLTALLCAAFAPVAVAQQGPDKQDGEKQDREKQDKGDVRVTKAPKLIKEVKAEYTDDAVESRIEGPVKLRLTISEVGAVTKVEVLEGLGHGLDESAVKAAKQFEFEPAEINNQPAAVVLTFTVNFTMPILPAALEGRVVDSNTGNGVAARVSIEYAGEEEYDPNPQASMTTEVDGTFGFEQVPPGEYQIRLQVQGYDDFESTLVLPAGETSEVTYRVEASAQNLVGIVRETGTRKPLSAVRVQLWEPKATEPYDETYSEEGGQFGFRGVPPGTYSVRFIADGYFTSTAGIKIETGEVTEGTFFIEAEYYDEYSVTTVAKRARTEVNRRRLELEEVRRIPGTGGDVVRVVQNLPGVARSPGLSGLLIVRGSAPQDTKVYLDGDEIPAVYHFLGGPAVINSEMIDSLEFFPGNYSTYYGRSIGGVIDLSTRSPNKDRIHGIAEVDLLDTTILAEGPITEDLSIALSGRRSYFDVFLPLILPPEGPDVFVAPRYYDFQTWITYRGIENHLFEVILYGSDDRLEVLLPPDEPAGNRDVVIEGLDFVNSFYRGQFKWQWRPKLPIENDFFISYGWNKLAFDAAENLFFELGLYSSAMRDDLRLKFSDNFTLRTGVDSQFGDAQVRFASPLFSDVEDDTDQDGSGRPNFGGDSVEGQRNTPVMQPAVYIEPEIKPYDKLLLVPGLRVDHFGTLGVTTVSPRFNFRWDFIDRFTAKGGVGLFTQNVLNGSEDPEFGNPNLVPEKAMQYALGAEWRPLDFVELDTTAFYRDMFDLLSQTDAVEIDDQGEVDPVLFLNEGLGRAYGAEVLLRHYPQNRFFGWVAYTLSWSDRFNQISEQWEPYEFDQRHILTLVAGYNLPDNWDVSSRFRLVSGNPTTPTIGAAYNADTNDYVPISGEKNSARDPLFHQLDIRVDKKFVFQNWLLGGYLDIQNVYNSKNPQGKRYNYNYTDSEPVRGLPFLPTIGIKGEFWADGPIVKSGDKKQEATE